MEVWEEREMLWELEARVFLSLDRNTQNMFSISFRKLRKEKELIPRLS